MTTYFIQDEHCREIGPRLKACIADGDIGPGRYVRTLEEKACELSGKKYAVATVSGTTALWLAMRSAFQQGAGITIPAYGHVAAINAALMAGLDVKLADINAIGDKGPLGLFHVKQLTTSLCVVWPSGRLQGREHWINEAISNGYPVIEDAACAFGEPLPGYVMGAVWSLSGPKIVSAGQGGILLTDEQDLAYAARAFCDQGRGFREHNRVLQGGLNLRMSNISAAYALDQCEFLEERWAQRALVQDAFKKAMPEGPRYIGGLHNIIFFAAEKDLRHAKAALEHAEIACDQPYRCLSSHPRYHVAGGEFPGARKWESLALYLPFGPGMTPELATRICEVIAE